MPSEAIRIVVWHWGRRGAGPLYALNMARALEELPNTSVFMSYSSENEQVEGFRALGLPSLEVSTFPTLATGILKSLTLPWIRRDFRNFLTSNRIDVVYCPMWHPWNAALISVIKDLGVPFILTVHDAHRHAGDSDWVQDRLEAFEQRRANGYITLSQHVKEQLVKRLAVHASQVGVIPLAALDYSSTAPRLPSHADTLRILFLGRILYYKGVDILLDAYREVRSAYGDRIQLTIAGYGAMSPHSASLADLEGVTVVNEWLSDETIALLLRQTDVLALPYREASQSGIVATAYGSGLPVVVTPIGGLVEQVTDGINGLISDSTDPHDFAVALTRLLTDPSLLPLLVAGAVQHAKESLTWHHSAQLLMEFIVGFLPRTKPDAHC